MKKAFLMIGYYLAGVLAGCGFYFSGGFVALYIIAMQFPAVYVALPVHSLLPAALLFFGAFFCVVVSQICGVLRDRVLIAESYLEGYTTGSARARDAAYDHWLKLPLSWTEVES